MVIYDEAESGRYTASVGEEHRTPFLSISPSAVAGDAPLPQTFTGALTDPITSEGLSGRTVELRVDGAIVASADTDSAGGYIVSHTFDAQGDFEFYARFAGDSGTG